MQAGMAAHRHCRSSRCPGREAKCGIGWEDAGHDQAESECPYEQRAKGTTALTAQRSTHANGACDCQESSEDEARNLDPSQIAKTQLADGILSEVVPRTGECLD